jgi:uncharacterized protein YgiM (DUF1202 family)
MALEEKVIVNRARSGFYMTWRELFLILIILTLIYFFYIHAGERGFDLTKLTNRTMIVKVSDLNLRTGPGTNYPVIKRLAKGSRVIYLNEYRNVNGAIWAKVRGNGNDGWVDRNHLSP